MKAVASLAVSLGLLLSAPAGAQAPDPAVGTYVADIPETATAIELDAEGRFRWAFSQGALDLFGEGRWTRDGEDALVLTSDPPVVAPAFELTGAGREAGSALVVRLDEQIGDAWLFLDVEAEYEDGERVREPFREAEHRFEPGRRIAAVRLGSVPFGFQSNRFAIDPGGANVLTFRLVPNDFGREDFRGRRVIVEPDALTFEWRGETLRYARLDESGTPVSNECAPVDAARRRVDVGLAEPLSDTLARSSYDLDAGRSATDGPVRGGCSAIELRIRFRGHEFDAGIVGGSDQLYWTIDPSAPGQVESIDFYYQDRLLTLEEAFDRARALQAWFERAGFFAHPAPPRAGEESERPFQLLYGPWHGETAADWDSAARRLLADDDPGVATMHLYTMRSGDHYGRVIVENLRRATTDGSGEAWIRTEGGREWRLNVTLFLDPALLAAINFPSD